MNNSKTKRLVQISVLAAVLIIMSFTPLGYLKVGVLSITFNCIPVVIGAIVIGPSGGAVLGGIFGITSFIQCFGLDAFGSALLGINPIFTLIMCLLPRICIGLTSGFLFKVLSKTKIPDIITYFLCALIGSVTNTVLFVSTLILFFRDSEPLREIGDSIWAVIGAIITVNSLIEAIVCMILGGIIAKCLHKITLIKQTR